MMLRLRQSLLDPHSHGPVSLFNYPIALFVFTIDISVKPIKTVIPFG